MAKYFDNKLVSLKETGNDENWVHQWIVDKPERLGIGSFDIIAQELHQYKNKGGRLDLLGYNKLINTYYEIEIMLGECDSDHGFRTLDYWARERAKNPNSIHYAVLVAEDLQGRYKTIIETLPQFLPFIAIEIQTLQLITDTGEKIITCKAEIIAQPDELVEKGGPEIVSTGKTIAPRDEDWWRQNQGDAFVDTVKEMASYCENNVGTSRIDFTANSYISLKKGKRTWLPMWPRSDGFYIYLPDDGTGTMDQPSERFIEWQKKLGKIGLELSWAYKYNGGANTLGFNVPKTKMKEELLLELLKNSYELA
ncbi:hypothetical protein AGMMS4952_25880 [Spirochaetia bacterium]|nr:hypothetical protein AGMMS4952_25880 [Spirochaetia bacterium]